MTVFKGYLKIISKNLSQLVAYLVIFVIICVLIVKVIPASQKGIFKEESVPVSIVDNDLSTLSQGLIDSISATNDVTLLKASDHGLLTRMLYERTTAYVIDIPEGFEEDMVKGAGTVDTTMVPDMPAGYYIESMINKYLREIRCFLAAGYSPQEAVSSAAALTAIRPEVDMNETDGSTELLPDYAYTFRFLPYLYISVMLYSVGYVLKAYKARDIRDRLKAAPISPQSQAVQSMLAFGVLFAGFWLISLITPLFARGRDFYGSDHMWLFVLNSLFLLADSVATAFLAGQLVHSDVGIAAVTNVISLGSCFLCGAFVPLGLLGSGVKKAGSLLPTYWYEIVNDTISSHAVFGASELTTIRQGMLIQALFCAALIMITLFIARVKGRGA